MTPNQAEIEPIHILLVEDSSLDTQIIRHNFQRARFLNEVHHVTDGAKALDILFHRAPCSDQKEYPTPQLVLLDLHLPRIDGWEVLETLRNHSDLKDLPVLVMTSTEEDQQAVEQYERGPTLWISKPIDLSQMLTKLIPLRLFSVALTL